MEIDKVYKYQIVTSYGCYEFMGNDWTLADENSLQIIKNRRIIAHFKEWLHIAEKEC